MKIKVTQEHIDNGIASCKSCPIALAMWDCIPGVKQVHVGEQIKWKTSLYGRFSIRGLSDEVYSFIKKFDSCEEVEPFEFEL